MKNQDQYFSESDSVIDTSNSDASNAQEEWDESIRELQVILTALVFPVLGKLLGRQFALKMFTHLRVNRFLRESRKSYI
ncbi:hypothetical protein V1525DRAFT_399635 [Lipomyces kononenkoae]|uniref:Uncharacterized protein n=1 Tax=Lipomyces kononenkoae TaxID=34357 RepID=A0ACC3T6H4_LIPKO